MKNTSDGRPISWFKSALAIILTVSSIAILFLSMTYWRVSHIDQSIFSVCQSSVDEALQSCLQQVSYQYLLQNDWLAIQFTLYLLVTALIVFLSSRRRVTMPMVQATLIGIVSAVSLAYTLEPGRFAAISAFSGALFGGLLAMRLSRSKFIINQ